MTKLAYDMSMTQNTVHDTVALTNRPSIEKYIPESTGLSGAFEALRNDLTHRFMCLYMPRLFNGTCYNITFKR